MKKDPTAGDTLIPDSPSVKLTTAQSLAVYRKFLRDWLPCFTGSQVRVLAMVIDRTAGWRKTREIITLEHFVNGITTQDGLRVSNGCGLSKKSNVSGALSALEGCGIIKRKKTRAGTLIELNTKWESSNMGKLKSSNKEKQGYQKGTLRVIKKGYSGLSKRDTQGLSKRGDRRYKEEDTQEKIERESADAHSLDSISELEALVEEVRSVSDKNKRRARRRESAATYLSILNEGSACPIPATVRSLAQIKRYKASFSDRFPDADFCGYLEWITGYWSHLRWSLFRWMNDNGSGCPEYPDLGIIVGKLSSRLEQAWRAKEEHERVAELPFVEREVWRLMREGMSAEEARKEAAKRDIAKVNLDKAREERRVTERSRNMPLRAVRRLPRLTQSMEETRQQILTNQQTTTEETNNDEYGEWKD